MYMTELQNKFVELEKQRTIHKQFFEDLTKATQAVADELGVNGMFQAEDGVVYKIVTPAGRWIQFETISYVRTKREGEQKGSLSIKEAKEAGFEV